MITIQNAGSDSNNILTFYHNHITYVTHDISTNLTKISWPFFSMLFEVIKWIPRASPPWGSLDNEHNVPGRAVNFR